MEVALENEETETAEWLLSNLDEFMLEVNRLELLMLNLL